MTKKATARKVKRGTFPRKTTTDGRGERPQVAVPLPTPVPADPANETYLSAPKTKARYGHVTDPTLERWLANKQNPFPQPIYINGRRYWRLSELISYERECAALGRPEPSPGSKLERYRAAQAKMAQALREARR